MTGQRVNRAGELFRTLQGSICTALEKADGAGKFGADTWDHPLSGGGITRVLENGTVIEKGAVNYSLITTELGNATALRLKLLPQAVSATGISLIIHPRNPFVPTVHANFRFLELADGHWWFGGGADLTPYYLFEDDARHFHSVWKRVCDAHDHGYYPNFKAWCDRYFFLPHRREARGVGGIFFDDLTGDFDALFRFVGACGTAFEEAYLPIVERRASHLYTDEQKMWHLRRRSRYAEFNLLYDKGTVFGLDTGGRVESILVSLPPVLRWDYDVTPAAGSDEARLIDVLRTPRSWV